MFSRFDGTSTCDGQTDRQSHGHDIYHRTVVAL